MNSVDILDNLAAQRQQAEQKEVGIAEQFLQIPIQKQQEGQHPWFLHFALISKVNPVSILIFPTAMKHLH